jgi:hypothetical protein
MFTCEYNTKDMTEHVKKHQYYWCGYCPLDSLTLFTSCLQLKNHTKFYHREAEVKLVSEPKCELLFKRIDACEEFEDGVCTRKREKSNKHTVSSSKTKVKPSRKSNEGKLRTRAENSVKMQAKNQREEPAVTTCKRSDGTMEQPRVELDEDQSSSSEPKMISNVDEMPQSKPESTAAQGTHIQPENGEISRTSLFNKDFTCAQKRKNTSKPQEFSKTNTTLSNSPQKCTQFYSRKKNTLKCKKVLQVRLVNFFKQQVDYLPQLFLEHGIKKVVLPQSLHQHFLACKDSKYFRASQPF